MLTDTGKIQSAAFLYLDAAAHCKQVSKGLHPATPSYAVVLRAVGSSLWQYYDSVTGQLVENLKGETVGAYPTSTLRSNYRDSRCRQPSTRRPPPTAPRRGRPATELVLLAQLRRKRGRGCR